MDHSDLLNQIHVQLEIADSINIEDKMIKNIGAQVVECEYPSDDDEIQDWIEAEQYFEINCPLYDYDRFTVAFVKNNKRCFQEKTYQQDKQKSNNKLLNSFRKTTKSNINKKTDTDTLHKIKIDKNTNQSQQEKDNNKKTKKEHVDDKQRLQKDKQRNALTDQQAGNTNKKTLSLELSPKDNENLKIETFNNITQDDRENETFEMSIINKNIQNKQKHITHQKHINRDKKIKSRKRISQNHEVKQKLNNEKPPWFLSCISCLCGFG